MIKTETIEVNGSIYELQHPGNREWLKLKQEIFKVRSDGTVLLDMISMLDYCFEHVVFPADGPKLNIDTIDIEEVEEVWGPVLQQFLKGKLEAKTYSTGK